MPWDVRFALRIRDHYHWRITLEHSARYEHHNKRTEGGVPIIFWVNISLEVFIIVFINSKMYMFYIFVVLKTTPCSITNRIKCHAKIQTEQLLFFYTMKTFVINNESYSHDEVILCFTYFRIFPIYYSNGYYTNCFANNHLHWWRYKNWL